MQNEKAKIKKEEDNFDFWYMVLIFTF